jgi:acetoacetate decarboxylase
MGFVKTAEEIKRIQEAVSAVEFNGGEYLGVEFLSDAGFVESVLPPGLEPLAAPKMSAMVCRFKGGSCGPFNGGAIYVAARRGKIEGNYTLAMYMDSDNAILFGRDIFGEPKKLAAVGWNDSGERATGSIDRGGVQLIKIDARLREGDTLTGAVGQDFNYKVSLAPDGIGLASDPVLTLARLEMNMSRRRVGKASLVLHGTTHDPLDEIPIREILDAQLIEADFRASARALATVPAAEFLPYAYGRLPDWSVFFEEWRSGKGRSHVA